MRLAVHTSGITRNERRRPSRYSRTRPAIPVAGRTSGHGAARSSVSALCARTQTRKGPRSRGPSTAREGEGKPKEAPRALLTTWSRTQTGDAFAKTRGSGRARGRARVGGGEPEDVAPAVVGEVEADLGPIPKLHHADACRATPRRARLSDGPAQSRRRAGRARTRSLSLLSLASPPLPRGIQHFAPAAHLQRQ